MSKSKYLRAATLIMICTIISKGIGFFRDILVAGKFGATYQTDAYNVATTVTDVLVATFTWAIMTTFIPVLSDSLENRGKEDMFDFASNVMNILSIFLLLIAGLGFIFAPQIVKILATDFTGEAFDTAVRLTKISVFSVIFMGITGGHTAILQTLDDFTTTAIVGIVLNIPIVLYIVFGAKAGIYGLMIATAMGHFLRTVVQIPWLKKNGYKQKWSIDFKDKRVHKMFYLILPVLIGVGVNQINAIVNTNLASGLDQGSVTSLTLAGRLTDVVYATFGVTVVTVLYPALSREASLNNFDGFKSYLLKAVNNISIIMIPCTFLFVFLGKPIIMLLFRHGAFTDNAVHMTTIALIFYAIGITFYGVRDVFNRALYALNDTKTSTKNGIIGVASNTIFNLLFVRYFGIGGLAFGTSLAAIICTLLLYKSLERKIGDIHGNRIIRTLIKIIISSTLMGATAYGIYYIISVRLLFQLTTKVNLIISLTFAGLVAVVVYGVMLKLLKVEEMNDIISLIKSKFGGRK